jgi:FkbM family methyltransferase
MSKRLSSYTGAFGLLNGLRLYLHTKRQSTHGIKLPSFRHPLYFRKIISDRVMFEQLFIKKQYDIEVGFEPKVILDLGANVGFASVLFANRFPTAKIFAIEPDEQNFRVAQKNTSPYDNIRLVKGAVWHKPESINLVDLGYGEASYMVTAGTGEHTVRAYTIKEIMGLMGTSEIDILKMDVEGAEKEIFEVGAEEWVPQSKIIIVETHDRYKKGTSKAIFKTMVNYNFSLELSGENLVFYNDEYSSPG